MGSFFPECALQKWRHLSVVVQWDSQSTKLPIQTISVTQHTDGFYIQADSAYRGLKAEPALKSFISV